MLSAISGVAAYFLIKNTIIAVSFGFFVFIFNLILLLLLLRNGLARTFNLKTSLVPRDYFYIALGVIASICILAIPSATVQLNPTSTFGSTFLSMDPLSYLRIVSAFFITGFFPGIIVYFVFFKGYNFNVVEKLGLVILISYCFTMISGLLLGYLQVFSTVTYVLAFWIFAAVMFGYRQIKQRTTMAEIPIKSTSFTVDINLIAIAFAAISLVIFSYIQVFASVPTSGIVGGDVLDYMVSATRFAWSDFTGWSPYVWSNNIYGLISNLAGLPMYFVYIGLQFYLLIPIASLYFLVRTIFPDHKKIAAIATLLCFFAAGIISWVKIGGVQTNLDSLFQQAGFPGITPLALSPWILDFGFLFFALAFVYKGVFKKERKLVNYVLPAIFTAAAFFSHSLNIIFVFIFSLVILGLFFNGCRAYVFKLSLLTLALVLALDPLSKWMLIDNISAAAVALNLQSFESINSFVISTIAIGMVGLVAVLIAKKRNLRFRTKVPFTLSEKTKRIFSSDRSKLLFYIVAFTSFGVAVFLYMYNFPKYSYNPSEGNNYPLEWTVCRSFGIILPFALASIPFMVHHERDSLLFTTVLSISIFISTAVSIAVSMYSPAIIPPYIGYVRYIAYLVMPLSILAAFGIFYSMEHLKKRYFRALFVIMLVVLASTSILSQAYGRERLFDLGQTPAVLSNPVVSLVGSNTSLLSANMSLAIDWMNSNLTKGVTILPLSLDSEKILSNFLLGAKVAPNFQTWRLRDVLLDSNTEIVLYCLNTLGINYIFVDTRNRDDNSVSSIVQSFPVIYSKNETTIYKTRSSLFNDSNSMPYLDSLFKKITYSLYEEDTGSTPMNNKVIWLSNITATGTTAEASLEMQISSKMISLNESRLFVSSMSVSTDNGSVTYESKALSDVRVKGAGDIIVHSPIIQIGNASEYEVCIDLKASRNVSLTLRNADIDFKSESYQSFSNANISIILGQSNPLATLCRQPIVRVNGNLTGLALGLAQSKTFYQNVTLSGDFTAEFPLTNNNLLYSQITNVKELKA